jgi:hypothetical protein
MQRDEQLAQKDTQLQEGKRVVADFAG